MAGRALVGQASSLTPAWPQTNRGVGRKSTEVEGFGGASERDRTSDLLITNQLA